MVLELWLQAAFPRMHDSRPDYDRRVAIGPSQRWAVPVPRRKAGELKPVGSLGRGTPICRYGRFKSERLRQVPIAANVIFVRAAIWVSK